MEEYLAVLDLRNLIIVSVIRRNYIGIVLFQMIISNLDHLDLDHKIGYLERLEKLLWPFSLTVPT